MNKNNQKMPLLRSKNLRFLPYILFGVFLFYFNSNFDTNYFIKGYSALLEAQLGIVIIYLLMNKLSKKNKPKII
jgi:hypothetical protein